MLIMVETSYQNFRTSENNRLIVFLVHTYAISLSNVISGHRKFGQHTGKFLNLPLELTIGSRFLILDLFSGFLLYSKPVASYQILCFLFLYTLLVSFVSIFEGATTGSTSAALSNTLGPYLLMQSSPLDTYLLGISYYCCCCMECCFFDRSLLW